MTDPVLCPAGHPSGDLEWCDTCGAPMAGGAPSTEQPSASSAAAVHEPSPVGVTVACAHCGVANPSDNLFCEACGYDFTTGQIPEPPAVAAPIDLAETPPLTTSWTLIVEVSAEWYAIKGQLADQPCPVPSTRTVAVAGRVTLVGRSSQSRGLRPEVALDADTGVSRRHAQFVVDADAMTVVDLSSTNGTYVVPAGSPVDDEVPSISAGVPVALRDGDCVYVGAWSKLTLRQA